MKIGEAMNCRDRSMNLKERRKTIGRLLFDIGGFFVPICGIFSVFCWSLVQLFYVHPYIASGATILFTVIFLGVYLTWDDPD